MTESQDLHVDAMRGIKETIPALEERREERRGQVSALTESRAFCSSKVALEDVPHGEVSDAFVTAARVRRSAG